MLRIPKRCGKIENGCKLKHCPCGTHDVTEKYHVCHETSSLDIETDEYETEFQKGPVDA